MQQYLELPDVVFMHPEANSSRHQLAVQFGQPDRFFPLPWRLHRRRVLVRPLLAAVARVAQAECASWRAFSVAGHTITQPMSMLVSFAFVLASDFVSAGGFHL